MKKIVLMICIISLFSFLMACNNEMKREKPIIQYKTSMIRENDSNEKVMEIISFVKNDKHFDFIRNVKVHEDGDYKSVLNMEEGEYISAIDKAADIIYPNGKIYLFHLRDINQMGSIMMKTINLKGTTIDDSNRKNKARYLVATCGNYLIVGIGTTEDNDEIKDIVDIFEDYFGKDNLDKIYTLLLEVNN